MTTFSREMPLSKRWVRHSAELDAITPCRSHSLLCDYTDSLVRNKFLEEVNVEMSDLSMLIAVGGAVLLGRYTGYDAGLVGAIPAQVPIRIVAPGGSLSGHTRDISLCGVLVSVPGDSMPVGTRVQLTIDHPANDQSLGVDATVTRQIASKGGAVALAIEFDPPPEREDEVRRFITDLQGAGCARRSGGQR